MRNPWAGWVGIFPWERQEHDTPASFNGFGVYRDEGFRRSLRKAAEEYYGAEEGGVTKAKVGQFEKWSTEHHWVEWAAAFDEWLEVQRVNARLQAVEEMSDRHAWLATGSQRKGLEALQALDPTTMNPGEILRFLVEATKLEGLARGEATVCQEVSGVRGGAIEVIAKREALPDSARLAGILAAMADAGIGQDPPGDPDDGVTQPTLG